MANETRAQLIQKIVDKANRDDAFKSQLKSDPVGAIKGMGMSTRPNLQVEVLEETAEQAYLVLPFSASAGGGELGDDALDAVTGGQQAPCALCGAG